MHMGPSRDKSTPNFSNFTEEQNLFPLLLRNEFFSPPLPLYAQSSALSSSAWCVSVNNDDSDDNMCEECSPSAASSLHMQ